MDINYSNLINHFKKYDNGNKGYLTLAEWEQTQAAFCDDNPGINDLNAEQDKANNLRMFNEMSEGGKLSFTRYQQWVQEITATE